MQSALKESTKAIISENLSMRNSMQRFCMIGICRTVSHPDRGQNNNKAELYAPNSQPKKRIKRNCARKLLHPLLICPSRKRKHMYHHSNPSTSKTSKGKQNFHAI